MLVPSVELAMDQVSTRVAPKPRRQYGGFLVGPHFNIVDTPLSQILLLNQVAKEPAIPIARDLVLYLHDSGCNALHLYPGYWWIRWGLRPLCPFWLTLAMLQQADYNNQLKIHLTRMPDVCLIISPATAFI